MNDSVSSAAILLALLDGAVFANALRRNGKPCRISLPDDLKARRALVSAHLRGAPATLTFHAEGREPWRERVDSVVLAAFCPAADGLCRWVGVDLDAADHGGSGLVDPVHAMRTLAERAAMAGLVDGLLAARSRRGRGRHLFLLFAKPIPLDDAVVGVAALVASAFKIATADVLDYSSDHAFRRVDGSVVSPGDAGAVELLPRSTDRPSFGWAITLPGAGAFKAVGGGVIVDPLTDFPLVSNNKRHCNPRAWSVFLTDARGAFLPSSRSACPRNSRAMPRSHRGSSADPLARANQRTRDFVGGRVQSGARNTEAFAAACALFGAGLPDRDVESLINQGGRLCGLPDCETRAVINSARRRVAS